VVAPPAQAAPGTCTIFWKGTTSTAWETATNWSLTDGGPNAGRLPNATDVVCKSTAPTRTDVVITTTNRAVAGMNFGTGSLTLSANLTVGSVANGAFDSTIRNIASNGFTLGGTAAVTLTGPGDPVTPVNLVLAGAGPVAIGSGSALNYSALSRHQRQDADQQRHHVACVRERVVEPRRQARQLRDDHDPALVRRVHAVLQRREREHGPHQRAHGRPQPGQHQLRRPEQHRVAQQRHCERRRSRRLLPAVSDRHRGVQHHRRTTLHQYGTITISPGT
jgi:hypothetical protein